MLQRVLDCPKGYGAMNGHAETHGQFCQHHAAIRYDTVDGRTLETIKGFKMEDHERAGKSFVTGCRFRRTSGRRESRL
jgi:hypothetical protein